ncbi:MAG: hypothetical protein HDT20_03805 [Oscillibacter sp.]|nr:hypothetical protein [Oscillibacter sp.]
MRTIVDKPGTLFLGKQGENMALELAFREPALWREEFGAGAAQLLVRPPGNCGPAYPVVLEYEDGLAVWRITAADIARPGYGRCELRWSVEGLVVKSKTYVTYVAEGLSGGCGCGTDNWGAYLEKILQAGAQTLEAASRVENAAVHGPVIRDSTWWCWDADEGGYADTGVPATGEGGGTGDVDVATDAEIKEMLDEIFGSTSK